MSEATVYELPLSTVGRLCKAVEPSVSVGKQGKHAISRAAGLFALFLAFNANEVCTDQQRCTIQASDVLAALDECGFQSLLPSIKESLTRFQAAEQQKKHKKELSSALTDA